MPDTIILIPARMASSRLPGKPLADIAGLPMIVHVLRRAQAAKIGEAVVATDSEAVAAAVEKSGGRAIMTRADHVSGSDRIYEALEALDPEHRIGVVVNVQGDLPTLDPADIRAALGPLSDPSVDISTLAAVITNPAERSNPNVVKVSGAAVSPGRLGKIFCRFQFHNSAARNMAIRTPNMAVAISPTTTPFMITSPLATAWAVASSCWNAWASSDSCQPRSALKNPPCACVAFVSRQ